MGIIKICVYSLCFIQARVFSHRLITYFPFKVILNYLILNFPIHDWLTII